MTRILVLGLLLLGSAPCGAQELGRLFMAPQQRDALDARRKARVPDKPAASPVVASPTTRIDGYVKRSGGNSTVWVNGEPVGEHAAEAPRIRPNDPRVELPVGETGARVPVKPGQVLNRETGEVRDALGEGEVKVRSGQRK